MKESWNEETRTFAPTEENAKSVLRALYQHFLLYKIGGDVTMVGRSIVINFKSRDDGSNKSIEFTDKVLTADQDVPPQTILNQIEEALK